MVLNICYFHPYLGKIPILTNIFQMGWNHQLDLYIWSQFCHAKKRNLNDWMIPRSLEHAEPLGGDGEFDQRWHGRVDHGKSLFRMVWKQYGGFLKWWVYPTTMGFPTKNDHFGVEIGGTTI